MRNNTIQTHTQATSIMFIERVDHNSGNSFKATMNLAAIVVSLLLWSANAVAYATSDVRSLSAAAATARAPNKSAQSTSDSDRYEQLHSAPAIARLARNALPHILVKRAPQDATQALDANANEDFCADRLCYGLPMGCINNMPPAMMGGGGSGELGDDAGGSTSDRPIASPLAYPAKVYNTDLSRSQTNGQSCTALVTSKRNINPEKPNSREIMFELIAQSSSDGTSSYAAVGFSENGRMGGLVIECIRSVNPKTPSQSVMIKHSYNVPGEYTNVKANIHNGFRQVGLSYESGFYKCSWIVDAAVDYSFTTMNNTTHSRREDLGYKNYHILLATGVYDDSSEQKQIHTDRVSSMAPVSLAQTGHIKSLGSHILIRIHGSLMIAIWVGLVTLSIVMARYYKNEWSQSKINDLAIWFVVHRTLMLTAWFGTIIAIIFAYMYTETYHPGIHQISGTTCLILATIQIIGGLFRPSPDSSKRSYFNWAHFLCGNLSYLAASK